VALLLFLSLAVGGQAADLVQAYRLDPQHHGV
jgi:hypothetical protein